ncbi:HAD-like protein [Hysterangium stoloniferum]|nr:HAD-like protein [Hysterangium stoloniferum]
MLAARSALKRQSLRAPFVYNAALAARFRSNKARPPREPSDAHSHRLDSIPESSAGAGAGKTTPPPSSTSSKSALSDTPPPGAVASTPPPSAASALSDTPPPGSSADPPRPAPPPQDVETSQPPWPRDGAAKHAAGGTPGALSLDFIPSEPAGTAPDRTGARSSKGSLSSIERRRRVISKAFLVMVGLGLAAGVVHMGRPWEAEEMEGRSSVDMDAGRWARTVFRFKRFTGVFLEPAGDKLLPPKDSDDPRRYTLVLSIDDLLVSYQWDRQKGWRTAKRPGVDYFLGYLNTWFEIVIFTTQHDYTAEPILMKLDPLATNIQGFLFRNATKYHNGTITKDLSYLNRDLSRVIAIDTDGSRYALHPDNAVIVPKWDGDPKDKGLVGLIPFLESIGIFEPNDVRPIVKTYKDKDIIAEFSKFEAENKKRHIEDWERKGGRERQKSSVGFLAKLFGLHSLDKETPQGPPLTFLEKSRLRAQYLYQVHTQRMKANEEALLKWQKDQQDAHIKAMGGNTMWRVISNLGKPPPTIEPIPPPVLVEVKPPPPPPGLDPSILGR